MKIFILYAPLGNGHKVASQGLMEAFRKLYPKIHTEEIDVFRYANPLLTELLSSNHHQSKLIGPLHHLFWKNFSEIGTPKSTFNFFYKNFESLINFINKEKPDIIISTLDLIAFTISTLKLKSIHNFNHVIVSTDLREHAFWPKNGVDLFCTSTPAAKLDLVLAGLPEEKIVITGIPLRQQFNNPGHKRRRNNLSVLILAGALQDNVYSNIAHELVPLIKKLNNTDCSFTILCGSNEKLQQRLMKKITALSANEKFTILGFSEKIAELMSRHDIMITKAGGLICSECVALGLPMILLGDGYGQESANRHFLTDLGAAVSAKNSDRLISILQTFCTKPQLLQQMKDNAGSIYQTGSSDLIAKIVVGDKISP